MTLKESGYTGVAEETAGCHGQVAVSGVVVIPASCLDRDPVGNVDISRRRDGDIAFGQDVMGNVKIVGVLDGDVAPGRKRISHEKVGWN